MIGATVPRKTIARTPRSKREKRTRLASRALGFLSIAQDLIDGARELSDTADAMEDALTKAHRSVRAARAVLTRSRG